MSLGMRIPRRGGEAPRHTVEPEFLPSAPPLKLRMLPDPIKTLDHHPHPDGLFQMPTFAHAGAYLCSPAELECST